MTWPPEADAPIDPQVAAFLDAIVDDPAVRLIFADWLDERDDPRGALVRLQAEYAAANLDFDRTELAEKKARAWGRKHLRAWLGTLPRGGVVDPNLARDELNVAGKGAAALVRAGRLPALRRALSEGWFRSFETTHWTEADYLAAADQGLFRRLHSLAVISANVTDASLEWLAGLSRLRWLHLWHLDAVEGRFLARFGGLAQLGFLVLEGCPALEEAALASLPALPALRGLLVRECPQVGGVAVAVAARHPGLESLALGGLDRLRDADLAPLAGLAHLRELRFYDCPHLGDAGVAPLAGLTRLEELALNGWRLTGRGLARLHGLTSLKWLGLYGVRLPAADVRALRKALPGCEVVR